MHPTPDVEIEFWKNKANNLNSIFEQLQGPQISRVLRALDQSKSTYCTTFARLCKEVFTARLEANDNMKYLRTLEEWFDKLNGEDSFPRLLELFKPTLHIILLIWKNSKHYNTPARLVVLMREICNSLIMQACKYSSGEQIFSLIEQDEAAQAVEQLKTTLHVCGAFKSTYFDYKATANAECPANPWRIQNNALFMRLDSFLERCHDILDLTQTIVQFSKLAKIEVGGTKGNTLTASIKQIFGDFEVAVDRFKNVPYDIMDVAAKQFDDDFYEFRCSIKELERRLGAVVSLAFDDCSTVYGRFKLLDSFEGLLDRPIIQDELEKKYVSLVQSYGADLKTVQELFLRYRDEPPIGSNLPPIAGSLAWCRGLIERIQMPMGKLQQLDKSILDREEAKEVAKVYATIMASLVEYESQKIEEWGRDVEASSQAKLKLPLLIRDPQKHILSVNFDPALVKLLREVKYFLLLKLSVPESALLIYQKVETFRRWTGNLDLIVNMNNDVLMQLLPVEKPLVQPYLEKFDRAIANGTTQLCWKSDGIDEFIDQGMEHVLQVHEVTRTMKTNLGNVKQELQSWAAPLMERKPKPMDRDEFERLHKHFKTGRYSTIKDGGKEIQSMLKETNKVLKCSNASPTWRSYVDYVNNVVVSGLCSVVCSSLDYLQEQIEKPAGLPMIEVKLELTDIHVKFSPEVGFDPSGKGLRDLVHGWVGSFFQVATLFKRLDNDGTYVREIHGDSEVQLRVALLTEALEDSQTDLETLRRKYEEFSYLWMTPMESYFAKFCEDATIVTELGQPIIDIKKFDEAIKKYEAVQASIKCLSSPQDIGWVRVNVSPIKQSLLSWASKWVSIFTAHLQATLVKKLYDFDTFIADVGKGLDIEVEEGPAGKDVLMNVMKDIASVRRSIDTTTAMFQPLRQNVLVLKQHGVDVGAIRVRDREVHDYLEEAPMAWDALVKKTFQKKEEILPMQLAEVDALKIELEEFFLRMREFRNTFRAKAPFSFTGKVEAAYRMMEEHAALLVNMEASVKRYNELEDLFELQISKYPEIKDTREELRLLKGLWDFKALLNGVFISWRTARWQEVDTEALDDENKLLLKQLRKIGNDSPNVKGWQIYRDIEDLIKNMAIVLPLINDLHSPAMRDRHWRGLATVCEVKSIDPSDANFTLDDMMLLNLHLHVEDVSEIVETAQKELKIENKLGVIEKAWTAMTLDYVAHKVCRPRLICRAQPLFRI
jgi:dynein heavy chain